MIVLGTADYNLANIVGWTLSDSDCRSGVYSYHATNANLGDILHWTCKFESTNQAYFRVAVKCTTSNRQGLRAAFRDIDGGLLGNLTSSSRSSTGVLNVRVGTTIHESLSPVPTDVWTIYEWGQTETTIMVKQDGVTVSEITGLTLNTADIADFIISSNETNGWTGYVDDVMVTDQDWPGRGHIEVYPATELGNYQEWDDTYVTDAEVPNKKQSFKKQNLFLRAHTVTAATVATQARLTGHGSGAIKLRLNDSESDPHLLGVSTESIGRGWAGPWTPAEFNALEFGVASA